MKSAELSDRLPSTCTLETEYYPLTESAVARAAAFVHRAMHGGHGDSRHQEIVSQTTPAVLAACADLVFGTGGGSHAGKPFFLNQKVWNKEEHTDHDISEEDYAAILQKIDRPVAVIAPTGKHADVMRVIVDMKDRALPKRADKAGKRATDLACVCVYRRPDGDGFSVNTVYGLTEGEYSTENARVMYADTSRRDDLTVLGIDSIPSMTQRAFDGCPLGDVQPDGSGPKPIRVPASEKFRAPDRREFGDQTLDYLARHNARMLSRLERLAADAPRAALEAAGRADGMGVEDLVSAWREGRFRDLVHNAGSVEERIELGRWATPLTGILSAAETARRLFLSRKINKHLGG